MWVKKGSGTWEANRANKKVRICRDDEHSLYYVYLWNFTEWKTLGFGKTLQRAKSMGKEEIKK